MNRLTAFFKNALYLPLFVPVLFTPFTFFAPHFGKTMIFQLIIDLVLGIFLVSLALGKRTVHNRFEGWKTWNWLDRVLLVFLCILIVTSIFGVDPSLSFWGNQARENGALLWLHLGAWYFLMRYFWNFKEWQRSLMIVVGVGFVIALSGFFQNSLPSSWGLASDDRLQGILGNPAYLSLYLLPVLGSAVLAAYTLWSGNFKTAWKSGLAAGAAVIMGGALVLTASRGSVVGLAGGVFAGILFMIFFLPNKKDKKIGFAVLCGILVVGIGLLLSARTVWVHDHIPLISRFFDTTSFMEGTGKTRLMAWKIAGQGFVERPAFGWGLNTFEALYSKYYNPVFLKYSFSETVWDKPHNWFLEIANSAGGIGFISYCSLFIAGLWLLLKNRNKPVYRQAAAATVRPNLSVGAASIIGATLIGYAIQLFFLFETTNSLLIFFWLIAYVAAVYGAADNAGTESQAAGKIWYKPFVAIVLLAILVQSYKGSILPLRASYHLVKAHAASDFGTWSHEAGEAIAVPVSFRGEVGVFLAERFVQLDKMEIPLDPAAVTTTQMVAAVLEEESARHPLTIAYPIWAAQIYAVLGEKIDAKYLLLAQKEAERALQLSPRKQDILFILGRIYLLQKDFPKAIAVQQEAIAVEPSIAISHWFLGLTYQAAGQNKEALDEIHKAVSLGFSPTDDQQFYILDLELAVKDYDAVIKGYTKFLEREPENQNWYIRLATIYAVKGDKKSALEFAEKAVALDPSIQPAADEFIKKNNLR